MKVYQYWCEYLKGKPFRALFFHLFRCLRSPATWSRSRGLISLDLTVWGFGTLPKLLPFEVQFYLVTLIHPKAYNTICAIGDGMEDICAHLFPKYWIERHFLTGNKVYYVYKEENLTIEYLYLLVGNFPKCWKTQSSSRQWRRSTKFVKSKCRSHV